jgi:hypothetical protein
MNNDRNIFILGLSYIYLPSGSGLTKRIKSPIIIDFCNRKINSLKIEGSIKLIQPKKTPIIVMVVIHGMLD